MEGRDTKIVGSAQKSRDRQSMDFFDSPYFTVNKALLRLLGLWPYQSRLTKILIRSFIGLTTLVFCTPHLISVFIYSGVDASKAIQSTTIIFYLLQTSSKIIMTIFMEDRVQRLYEKIAQNWKMLKDRDEVTLLRKHSKYGRFLTISYLAYMFFALIIFITLPMVPLMIDKINRLNESRPKIFILQGEYLVDPFKHYQKVYIFESLTCILSVFSFTAVDSTYAVCVQQCIGLMDVVKMRLNSAKMNIKQTEVSEILKKVSAHDSVVQAAQYHQKAINFANTLEYTYALQLLIVLCTNASIISIGSVIILMNMNKPMEFIRFTLILIGLLIHIFYLSWPGQQLINISENVLETAYRNTWYEFSVKTQKILLFMMRRCQEPCQITAGGIYVMNVANCGAIIKASFSYITVFASMV